MNRRSHLQILGPEDTAFYYVDRPETPMNIGALCIFEGKFQFDAFIKMVELRIFRAPLYQQRVIQAPFNLGQPSWVLDPDFYVGNHVFRVDLPEPGTDEQLRELSGHLISGMLDRSKPLWELYQIDGLDGDRTALLFKVHHCMVDGLAAVELFTMLMDLTSEIPQEAKHPVYDPPYLPNATEMVTRAIRADIPHRWNVLKKIGSDVGRLGSVLTDKERRRQTFVGVANLINDNLSRIKGLPINGENSGKLTLAYAEFPLAEVKAIRTTQNASVNEVMLSILGGGVAKYLSSHAYRGKQEFMRVIVPVTMRHEDEKDDYGNRISVVPIDIPFQVSDPTERLRKVRDYSQIMKQSSLTIGLDLVLTLPSLYPSFAQPLIWGLAPKAFTLLGHSWCTNVAGPPIPVYIQGHQMQHCYGYFPLNPSMGLACVILSYNERITMTLVADAAIIPDVTDLRDCLQSAYTSLRQAAKVAEIPLPQPKPTANPLPVAVDPSKPIEAPVPVAAELQTPLIEVAQATPAVEPVEPPRAEESNPGEPVVASELPAMETVTTDTESAAPAAEVIHLPADQPPANEAVAPVEALVEVVPNAVMVEEAMPALAVGMMASAPAEAPAPIVISEPAAPHAKPARTNGKAAHTLKLFSEEWAQAYKKAINGSAAYLAASTHWEAGQLAFVIYAAPRHGLAAPTAVLLDLYHGECSAAHITAVEVATDKAAFVIEGDYDDWVKVLKGSADPVKMLMGGSLRLSKGSMLKLLPFTQSAQELVHSAQGLA